jgi:hypothetical protein
LWLHFTENVVEVKHLCFKSMLPARWPKQLISLPYSTWGKSLFSAINSFRYRPVMVVSLSTTLLQRSSVVNAQYLASLLNPDPLLEEYKL